MARLFLAIPLDSTARAEVVRAQTYVRAQLPYSKVAWVAPANFHITLHFLGDVTDAQQSVLVERLRAKAYPGACALKLRDVGAFPGAKQPRTVFVRATTPTEVLGLRKRTADVLVGLGLIVDGRPWDAHITIGRVRTQAEVLKPEVIAVDPVRWEVTSFNLMASTLTPAGSAYNEVYTFPFSHSVPHAIY